MRATVAIVALSLGLVACSGNDGKKSAENTVGPGREIAITTTDALKFEPATVTAKAGETVTFVVTNKGRSPHDFSIGSPAYQEQASKAGGHGGGHDTAKDGAAVAVPPGQTVKLNFVMPAAAPVYACHVDNHDDAGMKGTVVYN